MYWIGLKNALRTDLGKHTYQIIKMTEIALQSNAKVLLHTSCVNKMNPKNTGVTRFNFCLHPQTKKCRIKLQFFTMCKWDMFLPKFNQIILKASIPWPISLAHQSYVWCTLDSCNWRHFYFKSFTLETLFNCINP